MRLLIAAVVLGGAFGSASATVERIDADIMVIEIKVEVTESAESVVAHLIFDDEPAGTLPLLDRGDGTFGLRTELAPRNYFIVFETVGPEGRSSEPVSLTDLGADLGPETGVTTTTEAEDELSEESRQKLWLAVALGAASLSLLAFWVLGGREEEPEADRVAAGDTAVAEEE